VQCPPIKIKNKIMEQFALLLVPIIVTAITAGLKKIKPIVQAENKKPILRLAVVFLSFTSVTLTAWISGGDVDPASVETLVNSVFVFLSSSGIYFFAKKG